MVNWLLRAVGLTVLAALGVFLAGWGFQGLYLHKWKLDRDGIVTEARVTDLQVAKYTGRGRHEEKQLRYSFSVPGRTGEYRHDDPIFLIARDNQYATVSGDVYDKARDTGVIRVRYLKSNPSINEPEDARTGVIAPLIVSLLGLGLIGVLVVVLVEMVRGRLARDRVQPPNANGAR
jgi:hypothetical protein